MTVAAYGTDLQEVSYAESTTNWSEMTGRTSGGAATQEDRAYIQGSYCVSQSTGAASGRTVGLQFDYLSNISWTSGFVFSAWQYWQAPKAIGVWADGGMRFGVGSSAGNVKLWNAQGNNAGRNPYGGWANVAIDPTYAYDELVGTPVDGNYRIFCSAPYMLSAVSKGNPHCVDAIRYGRGLLKIEYGETGNYGTFAGMATANDADLARWGLFSLQMGTYLWKGLMSVGTASNAVTFIDSNRSIVIDDCPRTYLAFNRIEIRHASSIVEWSNISFKALGTLSPGQLEVVDNASVSMDGCLFTDMGVFTFRLASAITNCIFQGCKLVTSGGGHFAGTKILASTVAADASALGWNVATDPDGYLDDMTFSKGTNAHHAIEFGLDSPTAITLNGWTTTGFSASNEQNNSTFYIARTTGLVTINVVGGTGNFSYKSAGADVDIVLDTVTTQVTCLDSTTLTAIEGAAVTLMANGAGAFPYNDSVTITRTDSTAYVAHVGHGLVTGNKVKISGANQNEYNRIKTITVTSVDEYTYPVSGTPTTPATGTIVSTAVFIDEETPGSGIVSDSRVFSDSQAVTGYAAKGTTSPLYQRTPLSGTIDSVDGLSITAIMISDE